MMERSYVCRKQFCGKMFRNHSSLRRHELLVHTGEKRFEKEPFPFLEASPEYVSGGQLLTEDDEGDCIVIATIDPVPSNAIKNCLIDDDDDDCFVVEVKKKRKHRKLKEEINAALGSDTSQSNNHSGQENDTSQPNNNPGLENDESQPITSSGQRNDTSQTINNSGLENDTNQPNNNSGQEYYTSQPINNSELENDTNQLINNSELENETSHPINSGQDNDTSQTINNYGQENDTRQPNANRFHYMPRRSQRIYNRFYYLPRRSERLRKKFLRGRRKRNTHENDSENVSLVDVKTKWNKERRIVKEQGKKCNEPKRKGGKQGRAKRENKQFTLRNKKNDKWATKCRLCSKEFRCLISRQLHELRHSQMTCKRPKVILKKSDDITSCAQILRNSLTGLEVIAKRRNSSRNLSNANQTQSERSRKTLGGAAKQRNERKTSDFGNWKTSTTKATMNQRPRNKLRKVSERSADHKRLCASSLQNETTKTPNLHGNTSDHSAVSIRPLSICVMCRRPFQSETLRAKHEADHDLMKYSCPCGYKFENFSLLYRHSAVRHKKLLNDQYEQKRRLRPYFGGFVHREENVKASGSKRNAGNDFHIVNNSAHVPIPINPSVGEFHYSERYGAENSTLRSDAFGNNKQTTICSLDNLAQRSNYNSEISALSIVPDSLVPEPGSFVTVPDQPVNDNSMLEFRSTQIDTEPARENSPNRSYDNFRNAPRARRSNQTTFHGTIASKIDKSCKNVMSTPLPNSTSKTISRVPVMIGKDQVIVEGPVPMNMFRQFSNPISVTEIKKLLNTLTSGKWSMKIENKKEARTCSVRIEGGPVSVRHIAGHPFSRAHENCKKDTTKSKRDNVEGHHVSNRKKTPQNKPMTTKKRCPICPKEFETLASLAHHRIQHKDKRTTSHGGDLARMAGRKNVKGSVPWATKKRWKRNLTCLETPKRRKWLSKCPLCLRQFTFKTVRDKHVRNHDEMRYRCPAPCLYQFIDFKTFQRHYRDRHKGKLSVKSEKIFRLDKTMKLSVAVNKYGMKRKNLLSHRQERSPSPRTRNFVRNCTCSLQVAEGQVSKKTRVVLEEGTIPCAMECLAENTSFTKRCVAGRLHRYRLTLEPEPLNSHVQTPGITVAESNATEVDFRRPRSRPVIELDLEDVQEINDNSGTMSQFWNQSGNDEDHDEISNEITEELRGNNDDGNDDVRYDDDISSESTERLREMDNTSSDDDDVSSENTVLMCRDYDRRYEDDDVFSDNTEEIREKYNDKNDGGGNENVAVTDSDNERNDEDDIFSENTAEMIEKENNEGDVVDFSENIVRMYTGNDRNDDVSSENTEGIRDGNDRNDEDDVSSENTDEIIREEDTERNNDLDECSGENTEEFREEDNDRNEGSEDNKPVVLQTSSLSDDCRYYNFRSLIVILDDEDYNKKQKKAKTKEYAIDSPEKRFSTAKNNQRTQAKTCRLNAKGQKAKEQTKSQIANVKRAYYTKRRKDKSSIVSSPFSTSSQEITAETASAQEHLREEITSAIKTTDDQSVSGIETNFFEGFNRETQVRAQTCFAEERATESVISPQIDSESSSASEFTVSQTISTGHSIFDNSQSQPYCATSPTEMSPGPVSPPSAEPSSNTSTQISCDYVMKAFRKVNPGDDDILKEEVCDKSEADIIDVLLVPRSEEETLCSNVLIPALQKLGNEKKSLAKLEILRTLHNIEFQTVVPSVLNCGMMPWDSHNTQYETGHEDKKFCFTLVLPTLNRLDEERKSLASLEIQRVLHSLRFGLPVTTVEVCPK